MTARNRACIKILIFALAIPSISFAQGGSQTQQWRDTSKSPDERARLLEHELTLDEKLSLLHGIFALPVFGAPLPADAIGSGGYVPGVPRLGIPALQETDASLGVANPVMGLGLNIRPNDVATALPASIALAATFNRKLAYAGGAMVGGEARAKGFNVLLSGGVNLARDPRGGRNFEYLGEDPYLAGIMGGESIHGIQDQKIIATVKHFALNNTETNRHWSNSVIDEKAMRESDLLAFEIAIETGKPGSVMCSYNLVNGAYACGNDFLLNTVLKGDWGYKGFVMSDWGAVYGADFAAKGLDQQSGQELDEKVWFGAPLKAEVQSGMISQTRLTDMVVRILRTQITSGIFDNPTKAPKAASEGIDYAKDAEVARVVASEGIVLLKNEGNLLPLANSAKSILVIGDHAEYGVLSGGGSSNVRGSNKQLYAPRSSDDPLAQYIYEQYHASSPLAAIRALAPSARVMFDNGQDAAEAARKAKIADIVIVFGNQWMSETIDAPSLDLPRGQDEMIARVTAANPHTVVVLQTGGAVSMPWLAQAGAVMEAWYSGQKGGEAIADVLFGRVNPSGRLPVTFPKSIDQYPRKKLPGLDLPSNVQFDAVYTEGADVGYRRFATTNETPLFPFGYGLSYTDFAYSDLKISGGQNLTISFTVTNIGKVAGKDAPQVYLEATPDGKTKRLIGFEKVDLLPGETREITVTADPRLIGSYSLERKAWIVSEGRYQINVAHDAQKVTLTGDGYVSANKVKP